MKNRVALFIRSLLFSAIFILTGGCSHYTFLSAERLMVPALTTPTGSLTARQAASFVEDYDLLHVTEQMKAFVDPYLSKTMTQWQRADMLNAVLLGSAFLNVQYEVDDTLTASQAFEKESVNCVGFTNLYIALARHYGLNAKYQLVKRYPQWNLQKSNSGTMMSLAIHINTLLRLSDGRQVVVDIVPDIARQTQAASVISDASGKALFYNNLAIEQFSQGNFKQAYSLLTKALEADIQMDMLWVNLGAIFRHNNQLTEAESVYKIALMINPDSFTAMNNLAVLYQKQGNWPQYDYYAKKTKRHRQRNPYYHYYLAQEAKKQHDYSAAINHIRKAIRLKEDEPEFHAVLKKLYEVSSNDAVKIHPVL